jgi:hypothetical protein
MRAGIIEDLIERRLRSLAVVLHYATDINQKTYLSESLPHHFEWANIDDYLHEGTTNLSLGGEDFLYT